MSKEPKDLKQSEGLVISYVFDFIIGLFIIFGGIFVNIVAWIGSAGTGAYIFGVILFFLCLGIGVVEIKGAIDGFKKL